jgi:uncharacterized protein (DUF983 family)
MAASAAEPTPSRRSRAEPAKKPRRTRWACPTCGKVNVFTTGQVMRCRACGTYAGEADPTEPAAFPLDTTPPAPTPAAAAAATPGRDPPIGLAVGALACGLASALVIWVFPISLLLAIAAVALGTTALSRSEDDAGVQVMSIIGIVVAGLVLLFAFVFWPFFLYDDGGSSYTYYDGGSSTTVENDDGSSGGGGSGGGGGGGSSSDTGDSGGSSGGGGGDGGGGGSGGGGGGAVSVGGGGDSSQDSPAPIGVLVGAGLLGLAAWRRRA